MKEQPVIKESVKPASALNNVLTWFLTHGWPFIVIIAGGVKWYAVDQVEKDRQMRSDSLIYSEVRLQRKDLQTIKEGYQNQQGSILYLQGAYKVLDNSYTEHLKKTIKEKDDLLQYQRDQIEVLNQVVKKN